jgi:hypothetical protein
MEWTDVPWLASEWPGGQVDLNLINKRDETVVIYRCRHVDTDIAPQREVNVAPQAGERLVHGARFATECLLLEGVSLARSRSRSPSPLPLCLSLPLLSLSPPPPLPLPLPHTPVGGLNSTCTRVIQHHRALYVCIRLLSTSTMYSVVALKVARTRAVDCKRRVWHVSLSLRLNRPCSRMRLEPQICCWLERLLM